MTTYYTFSFIRHMENQFCYRVDRFSLGKYHQIKLIILHLWLYLPDLLDALSRLVTITNYTAGNFRWRKFSPISPLAFIVEILSANFFSCVKDCIADMATFTTLAKILSLTTYCNTKVAGDYPTIIFGHMALDHIIPKLSSKP